MTTDRYSRQIRFAGIGEQGQQRLAASEVLVVGCGALGSVIADGLTRAGVGTIRIVDRDFPELSNLQRQTLFDESDVQRGLPKAIAAKHRLQQINSTVAIDAVVADVDAGNIESLASGVDLILDGTDNFEIRFLINDVAIKSNTPWIYGGCLGASGQAMVVLPGKTACLNCLMLDGPPPPGTTATCDSAGILAPIINVIASFQVMESLKILTGNLDAVNRKLNVFEMWTNQTRQMDLAGLKQSIDCPTCSQRTFKWLSGDQGSRSVVLCGRNAVQISTPDRQPVDLEEMAVRLRSLGEVNVNPFLLRLEFESFVVSVFADGRAIVSGTDDLAVARTVYTKTIGN